MIWKATLVLSLALCALSDRRPAISEQKIEVFSGHHGHLSHIGQHDPEHHEIYAWAYPSYEFSYHVDDPHTHDMKGQHEIRDGDKVTGNYWLIQPDGRKRTVKYSSDHKNGFHAEVHYQPNDGHHYEVREQYENNHRHEDNQHWEHKQRRIGENRIDRWDSDHDRKGHIIAIDEKRGDNHDDQRHGHKIDNTDREDRRVYVDRQDRDSKRGLDHRRVYDYKRDHDDKRDREGSFWAWINSRKEHERKYHEGRKDDFSGRNIGHGQKEHWKHGVLIGWSEGRDRDYQRRDKDDHHRYQDEHNRARNNYHKSWDNNHRGDEKQNDDSHEDRRKQHSYDAPIMKLKPLIPYGQRLD